MSNFFVTLDNIIWSNPIIFLILGSAVFFTIILKGVQVRNIGHQVKLLFGASDSEAGISPFATFCTVIGYRVGTANVAGVAVAIFFSGCWLHHSWIQQFLMQNVLWDNVIRLSRMESIAEALIIILKED